MSGEVLNHSNSVTAQSTQALYPIKIDGQGHISAYGTAISSQAAASGGTTLSLVTTGEKYTWNSKTSNTGTVTSITLKAGTGISLDTDNTAITTSGTRTISNTGVLSIGGLTGAVTLADLGLSQALRFIGITSTALSDGATTATLTAKSTESLIKTTGFVTGDVVIDTNSAYEYVWTGSAWERLGGDSSYKTTQTAFTNSAGSADGTNTSTSFIYSFSQTANGNIIDIKTRALPIANSDTAGITTVGASGGAAAYSHGNHVPTTETANNAKFLRNDNTWQLVTPANIGAVTGNGRVFYGTCSTAASTAEKAVVCAAYNTLTNGDVIIVKFDNTNSAAVADLKLNVNSKGAKNIKKQYGNSLANLSSTAELRADTIAMFIYNGTYWIMTNCDQNSTYYTTAVYCSTAGDQAAKVGAVSAYTLEAGKHFPVMMIYTNTAQSALTLNISSKGAKPIYINGTASSSSNYTLPQGLYIVYYDGTNYHFRTDGKIPATEFIGSLTGNVTGNVSGTAANVTGTVAVENGGTGATTPAGARTNLGLGSIAIKADTDYIKYNGIDTSQGASTPAASVKTYWANNEKIPKNSIVFAYNSSGAEYTTLYSNNNNKYGTVLRWGYADKYLRILRAHPTSGTYSGWYTEDWEKISAGYADSAGSVALSGVSGADDLKAIEALTGTSGLLKKTAANTWTLDTTAYTTNTGTVTSVAASGSDGISISGSPITTSGTIAIGLNLSTAINGLGEDTSPAQLNDYLVAQYAGGGTTTTTYHRRKVSNVVNATIVKAALGTNSTHSNQFLRKDGTWQTPPYPVTSVAGNTGAITADTLRTSLGLSNAMHFLGVTTTNISTGTANTTATVDISGSNVTAVAGDVVLYGSQEYVWGNDKWNLLGDESSYKVKQTAVNDPTAATTTSTTFIDTISQDANGVITATKKTLPTASSSVAGITKVGASGGAAAYSHNHDGAYVPMTSGANNVNTLVNTGIYNITSGSATNTPKGYGYGQLLTMAYRKHSGNTTTDWASQLYLHNGGGTEAGNTSDPGNVLYYRTSNSSSSNTWFSWQKAIHADADYTKIGSTIKGVYIDESGKVQEMFYTVSKNVPSDAVFTDTKNTAGSTNSASRLYLIGATSQAANPTTNSYQYTYTDNGLLSALKLGLNLNGTEKAHLEWNNTDQSIDFIFE